MVHAGGVAESAVQLDEWIARTDDVRETLLEAGYGSAFTSVDLFPLLQSFVAKTSNAATPRAEGRSWRWLWIGVIVALAIVVGFGIAFAVV